MADERITDLLNSDQAQRLTADTHKAHKALSAAAAEVQKLLDEGADATAATDAEAQAFEAYNAAAAARTAFYEGIVERARAQAAAGGDKRTATELSLAEAAHADSLQGQKSVEQKFAATLKKRQAVAGAPKKATVRKAELAENITAVLRAADKTKQPAEGTIKEDKPVKDNKQPEAPAKTAAVKAAKPEAAKKEASPDRYRLKRVYTEKVVPALMKQFSYGNINEVPRLEKISLNMGLGDAKDDGKKFNQAVDELKAIAGQKPLITKAKKSVANFKVREGMNIGAKVTLRGNRMYEFLDKLVSIALPRVRDFKGVSGTSFDGRGNYALGVKEQLIFPEIRYDQIDKIRGFDVIIVTTAKTDEEAKAMLTLLGVAFVK
jgi:large subunit ribosomal protein L5